VSTPDNSNGYSADDHRHMARALQLAARGLNSTRPNPRVGCVIVKDGVVVGEGWHERAGEPHAETVAVRAAGTRARGACCYVTLEPCCHHGRTPPCSEALLSAGVGRVVAAMRDPNPRVCGEGLRQLQAAGVEVGSGLLAAEAEALNVGFCQRMRKGRPWVRAKVGMSLDGRVAMANGESRWITGEAARADVQRWRARSCAVATGVNTVIADDPALTVRVPQLLPEPIGQPLRVVFDSALRTPRGARVLSGPGAALVITAVAGRSCDGAETVSCSAVDGHVDLHAAMLELGRREVNEVLVEAGPTLTGALLRAGLVDELLCYVAPTLMGDAAQPLAHLPGLDRLEDAIRLDPLDFRQIGSDWRVIMRPRTRV
jgi:diaminohydroxyphosphoribosylaminopyrimidine deaminase/5-amino-6-(5-phosphoribosylamino)uracil reductase